MMLTRTTCFTPRWGGRYRTAMSAARFRQFAFAKGNAPSIDANHPTSSAAAHASSSRRRDPTIAVDGIRTTNAPCCCGGALPDTLSSLSYSPGLHCRFHSSRGARTPRFLDHQTLEENVEAAYNHIDILSYRDVAAFWTIVSKIQKQNKRRMSNKQRGFQGRKHNNAQQMRIQLDEVLCHTMEGIRDHDSRGLAQTTLALAKVVEDLESRRKGMSDRSPHDQIIHGLLVGNKSEIKQFIFKELALASMPILREFDARNLSNFIYAFGLVKHAQEFEDGSTLFDVLALAAMPNLKRFNEQDISNMLWAYANAGVSNSQLFKKVGDVIECSSLETFKEQAIANIVWAFATLNEPHPQIFKKVADHIMTLNNLRAFIPQTLANIVWAYAKANEPHPKLFKKVADHITALNNLETFIPQDLANIVWAYATARESHSVLFQKLAETAIQRKAGFNSQGIANFLWAYAANGHRDEHLFRTLAPMAEALLDKCNEQQLSNIAWAFAVVNVSASSLFDESFVMACKDKEHEFIAESLCQLHQWQIWQEELKSNLALHSPLRERCHEAFVSRVPMASALQDDVVSELKAIGLQPEEEVLTKRGYRLDAIVEVDGNKVGVEVDGPSHFLGRRPTGSTILKRRQVTNVEGLPLVSVPYWEWGKTQKDGPKKQKYLCSLLGLDQA